MQNQDVFFLSSVQAICIQNAYHTIELTPNNATVQRYYIKAQQITLWQVKFLA